jgi:hypothetical protein
MAEDSEKSAADQSAKPENKRETTNELPSVDSPSISPAEPEKEPIAPSMAIVPIAEPILEQPIAPDLSPRKSFRLRARHKVYAALAASVLIAGAAGVFAGVAASGGFHKPEAPKIDTAALNERKAMQQSIAKLNKEIGSLKSSLEAANKAAHTQIAKMSEKLTEKLNREAAEVTGSIAAPQTTTPSPPAPVQATTPLPTPRPTRMASLEPPRPSVVRDWSIRDSRDGYVYVQNQGEIYQVVPGAPLPGLGPVEQIKRQDGRWVVVTPRGLIVSHRDRGYFE